MTEKYGGATAVVDDGTNNYGTWTHTSSSDITTAADIGPAPSGGEKSVLRELIVSVDTACKLTLQEETSGTIWASCFLSGNSVVHLVFRHPMKLDTSDKKWQAKTDTSQNIEISANTVSEI